MERNTRQRQAYDHAWCTPNHDLSPSYPIYPFEGDEREQKISSRYDKTDCGWLVESDLLEECRRVIHECVEAA